MDGEWQYESITMFRNLAESRARLYVFSYVFIHSLRILYSVPCFSCYSYTLTLHSVWNVRTYPITGKVCVCSIRLIKIVYKQTNNSCWPPPDSDHSSTSMWHSIMERCPSSIQDLSLEMWFAQRFHKVNHIWSDINCIFVKGGFNGRESDKHLCLRGIMCSDFPAQHMSPSLRILTVALPHIRVRFS